MNLSLCSAVALSVALVSCTSLDPEYAEYKKKKESEAAAGAQAPFGQNTDPYGAGAGAANPYGVPGGETGSYTPTNPYQPLPGVNTPSPIDPVSPSLPPGPPPSYPSIPSAGGNVSPYQVVKGDTLSALARRYNTSVQAIQQANGMSDDRIRIGQTLQIPR